MRVLIVDDARVIRRSSRTFLRNAGVPDGNIFEAENGTEGLRMMAELDPDVVLLDIEMPDLSGEDVLIQALERDPDLRIVIISAHDRDDPRVKEAIGQGAFDALQKPIRQDMISHLMTLLHREQAGGGSII